MKSSLSNGNWSVIIISNNGDSGEPIAYERDFTLTVGPQSTSTVFQPSPSSNGLIAKIESSSLLQ